MTLFCNKTMYIEDNGGGIIVVIDTWVEDCHISLKINIDEQCVVEMTGIIGQKEEIDKRENTLYILTNKTKLYTSSAHTICCVLRRKALYLKSKKQGKKMSDYVWNIKKGENLLASNALYLLSQTLEEKIIKDNFVRWCAV